MKAPDDATPQSTRSAPHGRAWCECRVVEGCAVVVAGGEIDIASASALRNALRDATACSAHVVIDVSEVTFLDCTGLSTMVSTLKRARAAGGSVHLVGAVGEVRQLLAMTKLDMVFMMAGSVADAVRSVSPGGVVAPAE